MSGYFTEFVRWVGDTTSLVVSYVRGLLIGNEESDQSSIVETSSHKQVDEVNEVTVYCVDEAISLKGSLYIPLPKKLKNKCAIINMENNDDMCFKWSVTRALNPVERNPKRVTKKLRLQSKQCNWDSISFPTSLQNIRTFEKNNNVLINVFGFDDDNNVYPLRVPKGKHGGRVLLMLIRSEGETKRHYAVVKSLSRLLHGQATRKNCKRFYCNNCLNGFTSEGRLQDHVTYCDSDDCVRSEFKLRPRAWTRRGVV